MTAVKDLRQNGCDNKHTTDVNVNDSNASSENGTHSPQEEQTEEAKIQRRLKRSEGIYVEGEIEGIKLTFTADTGATRSIISPRIYNSISKQHRPTLRKSVGLSDVSGLPLKLHGCTDFRIKLGDLELKHELIVAE